MDFKELCNEVQLLRDELAIFKRKYEDTIYNLDSDNFGKSFTVAQNNMKAQIKIAADGIKTAVTKTELGAALESQIAQTADIITSTVTAKYLTDTLGEAYVTNAVLSSTIKQEADNILIKVSSDYETKGDVDERLKNYATTAWTADAIKSKVSETDLNTKLESYSTIEQTANAIKSTVNAKYLTDQLGDTYTTNDYLEGELTGYSTISQTKTDITTAVNTERLYITDLLGTNYYTKEDVETQIAAGADGVLIEVGKTYETKTAASDAYGELERYISTVEVAGSNISSRVTDLEDFKTSVFTQTADGFTLDGNQTTFTGVIFLADENKNKCFDIFYSTGITGSGSEVLIGSYGDRGTVIHMGNTADTISFADCKQIVWGNHAPSGSGGTVVAVFG